MARLDQQGRYDDAIRIALDWIRKHPGDSYGATFYDQIALTYLMKASKDTAHRDKSIEQAAAFFDKDIAAQPKDSLGFALLEVGRGMEWAGDLSSRDSCAYYGRAIRDFEEDVPYIQGDSYTAYGKTIPLAPIRQENDKSLQRVQAKFAKAGCN